MCTVFIKKLVLSLLVAVFCCGSTAFAAVDMFLKIDGIKGDSVDEHHADEIEIFAYSQDLMSVMKGSSAKGGRGSGKVTFSDISFKSSVGSASPMLMLACASGKHIPTAILTARKAGEEPHEYLKVELKEVFVTSYKTTSDVWQEMPSEDFSLSFQSIKVTFTPGDRGGDPVVFTWDLAQNK